MRIQILYENDQYVKDKKENGVFKEYYEDDQPKSEVTWKDGKKQGPFKEYHANGHWVERPVKVKPPEMSSNTSPKGLPCFLISSTSICRSFA